MKVKIFFKAVDQIEESLIQEMWALYQKFYCYSEEYFRERIPTRNTHFAFFYDGDSLVGFTGLRINRIKPNGKRVLLLYFGQAAIEPAYRGKNLLRRMSIKIGMKYILDLIFSNGYCWMDAVSFKSYLFFAKSMAEFYPSRHEPTPPQEREVICQIGNTYYKDAFNPALGTVEKEVNFVTDPSAVITERHLSSPDIRFYASVNPGYAQGHGLITVVPMSFKNLFHVVRTVIKRQGLLKRIPVLSSFRTSRA
jgi:hypothetical protein